MMNRQLFALFVTALTCFAVSSAVKVPLTVYYESLCPDSAKFISEQLFPVLKGELKDLVDVTWHPFGKSTYQTQGSEVNFKCHHGPEECYSNKVHACAIEHIQASSYQNEYTRESLTLDFITCMMRVGKNYPENAYPGAKCANDNHINNWENIQQCANSTDGSHLLMKHGDATNKFQNPLEGVPTVAFYNKYDASVNKEAQRNFVGALCKYVGQPQPKICAAHSSAVRLTTSVVPLIGFLFYMFW